MPMILKGAGVNHNATFLSNIMGEKELNDFCTKNYDKIHTINKLSMRQENSLLSNIEIKIGHYYYLLSSGVEIQKLPREINSGEKLVVSFDPIGNIQDISKKPIDEKQNNPFILEIYKKWGIFSIAKLSNEYSSWYEWGFRTLKFNNETLTKLFANFNIHSNHNEEYLDKIKNQTTRFIAQSGGAIENYTHTNSLESLDKSYQRGTRLFELDILKTSDGKYVAAHDWEHWKSITQYNDTTSISEAIFLSYKIHQKYTPLNMQRINEWFIKHPDAILITDKVNTPLDFANQFIDKSRLRMTLFSMDAVIEAQANSITTIMNQNILETIDSFNAVSILKDLGIRYLAVERSGLVKKQKFYQEIKNSGILLFAYNINQELGKDVIFTLANENDMLYGIYSDNWSISKLQDQPNCELIKPTPLVKTMYELQNCNFKEWIEKIKNQDFYILISAADDASNSLTDQIVPLGSRMDWTNKMRYAYVGIFNPKRSYVREYFSKKMLEINISNPIEAKIYSAGFNDGSRGDIFIKGKHSNADNIGRGLNIVVYDTQRKFIVFSGVFDTHSNPNPTRNIIY
jgi:hypothetical protein